MKALCLIPTLLFISAVLSFNAFPGEDAKKAATGPSYRSAALSLPFIANEGQVDETVAFYADTFLGRIFVTKECDVVYALTNRDPDADISGWCLKESFSQAAGLEAAGRHQTATRVNYFRGNDPEEWKRGIAAYENLSLGEAYAGIEVELVAHDKNVEKRFLVRPGARPEEISVKMVGVNGLRINRAGALEARIASGAVLFTKPVAWQETKEGKQYVEVTYRIDGDSYGFDLEPYDMERELIIDPLLASTYLGGTKDEGTWGSTYLCLDGQGCVYIAGSTKSADFPATPGAYAEDPFWGEDVFVAKFDPKLTTLLAATYLGGSGKDYGWRGVNTALDAAGCVIVSGQTTSTDFPVTPGAYDEDHNGGDDVFITRLSADLSTLIDSTFIGSPGYDQVNSMILDDKGDVYIAGITRSNGFPTTPGALDHDYAGTSQPWGGDIFVSHFDGGLTTLVASTYLGDTKLEFGGHLTLDGQGNVYIVGTTASFDFPTTPGAYMEVHCPVAEGYGCDIFISLLDPHFTTLLNSTFLGGTMDDWGYAPLVIDDNGDIYVTGHVSSEDYPTTSGAFCEEYNGVHGIDVGDDVPVTKLNGQLSTLLASTFLGGELFDGGVALMQAECGDLFVTGMCYSDDFPTTAGAYDETFNKGKSDAFVTRINSDLTALVASTFLGGSGYERTFSMNISKDGEFYTAGLTSSKNFPTTPEGFDVDYGGGTTYGGDVFVSMMDGLLSANPRLMAYSDSLPEGTGGTINFTLSAGED
ncbi:MAG: DUF7948 domain-containing protein, partial [Planctomycetota bacterium]